MADTPRPDPDETLEDAQPTAEQGDAEAGDGQERQKLNLDVNVESRGACQRHITVTVPREDVDRYFDKEYSEMMPEAHVPGFRPGHAPRKLVEHRFRKDVAARVKSDLLVDSLEQIHEDQDLSPISEPDLDLAAIEIPDEGPFTFEFDLEVRPQFDLPQWKGLRIEKPVREFSDADVDQSLQRLLANRGRLVPFDGPAEPGDYVAANLRFEASGQVLASATEEVIRIRPVLSFRDGKIEGFDRLMTGVRAGESRQGEARISEDAPNVGLRGASVTAIFDVLEVKKLELPELDAALLDELGGFDLEADLRDAIRDALQRRLDHQQRQRAREQITATLTAAATWDLPPELLQKQSHRELVRAVMELRRSGYSEDEIQAHENALRQNSRASTARALKEHFILERIAEDQEIDVDENDYEAEIKLIAAQSNESPRRVRAKLEKAGSMDVLRNQIIERKVVDLILEHAQFTEVAYEIEQADVEALNLTAAGGDQTDIPEAKPGGAAPAPGGHPEEPRAHG
jgi:trigger factor